MVLFGVILVLLAAAAGVVLIAGTAQLTDSVQIDVLGGTLSIPPLTLLITGMVLMSMFWLGWAMLRTGLRRTRRHRAEAKEAAVAAEAERAEQAKETKRLQEQFAAREQALVEERRLREEAEARAAGHGRGDTRVTTGWGADDTTVMDDRLTPSNNRAGRSGAPRTDTPADATPDSPADATPDSPADAAPDSRADATPDPSASRTDRLG